jgi:hypothetical protein
MALVAALSMPVLAQTSDYQEQTVPQPQETQAQSSAPAPAQASQQEVQSTDKANAAGVPESVIVLQEKETFLASNLTGATVYNANNEAIGDVNDVILSRDGKIDGMVIGVGGFLGIGEKSVAIKMDQIKMQETETGLKLVLDTTREQLAEAPEFKPKIESATQGLMAPDEKPAEEAQPVQPQQ